VRIGTPNLFLIYYYDARGECRWSNTEYVRLNQEKVLE
jgi:hypothetical protein